VALAHGEMVKQMLTWNSPLSVGLDFMFGLFPAVYVGYISLLGALLSTGIKQYFQSFLGFFACFSMFYVTLHRSQVGKKQILIFGLLCFVFLAIFPNLNRFTWKEFDIFYTIVFVSPAIVAIKHIIMLTRA
jgi:hypothetical protein